MHSKGVGTRSQRFSRVLDKTDRTSRNLGLRNSLYFGSTEELLWTKDEEIWNPEESAWSSPLSMEAPKDLVPELPPADRGRRAYLFMLSAFIIEAIMWGMSYSPSSLINTIFRSMSRSHCQPCDAAFDASPSWIHALNHIKQHTKISLLIESYALSGCLSAAIIFQCPRKRSSWSEIVMHEFMQVVFQLCYKCHESPTSPAC